MKIKTLQEWYPQNLIIEDDNFLQQIVIENSIKESKVELLWSITELMSHVWFRIGSSTVPSMTSCLPDSNVLLLLYHKRKYCHTIDFKFFIGWPRFTNSPSCVRVRLHLHATLFPSIMISSNIIVLSGNAFHRR